MEGLKMYLGRRLLKFTFLYADKWGHIEGKKSKWHRRTITFPDGFVPEEGKVYEVEVNETLTGEFTWNGETFAVCRASLADVVDATALEKMSHPEKTETDMQRALRQAGLVKDGEG
jgi:hypothetical protein